MDDEVGAAASDGCFIGVTCGVASVSVVMVVDGVKTVMTSAPLSHARGLGTRITALCDFTASPPTVSLGCDGVPLGPPVHVPPSVCGLRPYLLSRRPSTVTVDINTASAFPAPTVRELVRAEKGHRVLDMAIGEGYTIGVPTARWVPGGLTVTLEGPNGYVIQRSELPAAKRFPFVSAFLPGLALSEGVFAYEVTQCCHGLLSLCCVPQRCVCMCVFVFV